MRLLGVFLVFWSCGFCMFFDAYAENSDLASTSYVRAKVETKVDTRADANQRLSGTYTIDGVLYVPTPPMP